MSKTDEIPAKIYLAKHFSPTLPFISQKCPLLCHCSLHSCSNFIWMSNVYGQTCLSWQSYYQYLRAQREHMRSPGRLVTVYRSKFGTSFLGANFVSVVFKLLFASLLKVCRFVFNSISSFVCRDCILHSFQWLGMICISCIHLVSSTCM